MIVTLTANPSVDRTLEVPGLVRGRLIRATGVRTEAGGKGVNVSRALASCGYHTLAVLPCGGVEGARLAELLTSQGVEITTVPVLGGLRTNLSIVEPDGHVTKINEPGPRLTAAETNALAAALCTACGDATWVALSGTLPPGPRYDYYARLATRIHRRGGTRVAVDSSGPALAAALAAGPDVVKPNRTELAEASGLPVTTIGEAVRAARVLRSRGARAVLASLGPDGALLVDDAGEVHGRTPVADKRRSVGAGDTLLAGYLAAGTCGRAALTEALAWGFAAACLEGSRMPARDDLDRSAVRLYPRIDPHHRLTERA